MALIKGIDVILYTKKLIGTDPFGKEIYEEEAETISNVLVAPPSTDDLTTATDLYGEKAVYTLAIPKGDSHDWQDKKVQFFGSEWKTFGFPIEGIEENIPLDWNKKVMVEKYG